MLMLRSSQPRRVFTVTGLYLAVATSFAGLSVPVRAERTLRPSLAPSVQSPGLALPSAAVGVYAFALPLQAAQRHGVRFPEDGCWYMRRRSLAAIGIGLNLLGTLVALAIVAGM